MIPRRELDELRAEWSLEIGVIEKDYVLGWLLAGIAQHPDLARTWIFKGGTCLRKCYYETFRFSEDLDFTVIGGGPEEPDDLHRIFIDMADWLREECWRSRPSGRTCSAITSWRRGFPMALLRYAGANRLKVDIDYRAENGRIGPRRVEPYPLRRTRDSNLVLFVVNDRQVLRSYRLDRIAGIRPTAETFTPRFRVEVLTCPAQERDLGRGPSSRRLFDSTKDDLGPILVRFGVNEVDLRWSLAGPWEFPQVPLSIINVRH